ncbi:DUF4347 domain-containing protein [Oscillatoria acuminata]|uniref:Putative extracellular nuclease n=1 Tax=Oscillatoria acuminata PCC 6304 TaxID=56110 RepID=K9TFG7_9CYAN|nr:DUF4347 domain-containing protein [Oscillatoria acuminata]AFY81265.1 putative extracellular nuclease [Oscillatoria acuminata PCC 6304]
MAFLLSESTSPLYPIGENTSPTEILFADPTVTGYETLIASTPAELQVVVLDPNRDAIAQISEILSHQKQPLAGLHILSHAQSGMLHLGNRVLTAETLPEAEIFQWAKSLTPDADILLYGCNLAADLGGFVDRLAAITGADIAASDNLTGSAALGGDWELEARTGPIEVQIPFSAEAIGAYRGILAPTDLFISEYVEGSSNNKALEFYNGTGSAIDLAAGGYSVAMYFNGSSTAGLTINLTGTVDPGSTFVLAHNMADPAIVPNQTNGNGWFNGNDAIVLRKNDIILDAIGQIGVNPGTAWSGGGVSTLDRTLRRKSTITTGDTNPNNPFNPSLEWIGFPPNTFNGLGSHNAAPPITLFSGNLNYIENQGFTLLDPSATATDPDLTNFSNGTLRINFTSGATTDDILMIRNEGSSAGQIGAGIDSPGLNLIAYSGVPFATFTGGTQGNPLTINVGTDFATDAAITALMRNIIYGNISDNPLPGDRTVQFQLTDTLGLASSPATKTINFTTANDAPIIAVPGASFNLYDGTGTPNPQGFEYRTLPSLPIATTQNGPNLNTSASALDYAGYIARPDRIPLLDRNTGYTIDFTAQILAENHATATADKNGDGIGDRAGFSLIAISSDGEKGIEIGFWEDTIWVQEEGTAEPPPNTNTLFTHTLKPGESVGFDTQSNPVNYQLEVLGETYELLANGNLVMSGNLRNYTSASLPSFLPENPYTTPNFIFFGDNTPSASANFNLSAVSVTTGSSLPPLSVDEDMPLVIPGMSVADVDAGTNDIIVTLTVNQGTLTVNSGVTGGLAAANITDNGTNNVTLTGTISQINQVLADATGLLYQGLPNFNGTDTLTVVANDSGNSGTGGPLTDTKTVNITVNPVNDAPVLTLPTNQVVDQSINLSIPGINVADVDAGTQPLQVNLSVNQGFLTLNNFFNLTFVNGDGSGDQTMSFTGTLAEINSALSILNYQSGANYSGTDTINITVNDLGNMGTGGPLEVGGNISITVNSKGVLTLNEHSVSQILDQFPPASTSVPDSTVWHRFRLSAVHEPIITNNLTFGVTATGIGNTNISNLQLIADVNHNGIYDLGDFPVGTMETPLDITDGIRVSSFTVPIGDHNYLLIGGLNGLQEDSSLSVGLNSSNIVAANGNAIAISANGTVTQAAHLVEAIISEEIPPEDNPEEIPPEDNPEEIPPEDNSEEIPPEDNSEEIPPEDNSGNIPPEDNSGNIPPEDNPEEIPPEDNSENIPPEDNPEEIPSEDNSGNIPPENNSGNIPPEDNSGNIPPEDNSGMIPPVMVGGGESNGSLPWETDTVGEDGKPCLDMNLPESPKFLTVGGDNRTETIAIGSEDGDLLIGGYGNDALVGSGGDDQLYGEDGDDHLYGGDGNDMMRGGIGSEVENTPGDADRLEGGTGNDELHGNQGNDTIFAGQGDDTVYGGKDEDLIWGDRGSDILYGNKGSDTLFGGTWTEFALPSDRGDILYGNEGDDYLSGNEGNDTIYSGQGNDIAWGGADHDLIYGDRGSDTLLGDAGNDTIYGGPSDPSLADQDGDDYISGGSGDDFINGNQGDDIICGADGDDTLHGGKGNDFLTGGSGNDLLIGDQGDDILCGGDGDDTLIGGSGSDRFIVGNGRGTTTIADFESGIDQLMLARHLTWGQLSIQSQGGVTTISSGGKVIAIVQGVTHLTAEDFGLTGV